jgi:hypothetical protein
MALAVVVGAVANDNCACVGTVGRPASKTVLSKGGHLHVHFTPAY